MPEPTRAPISGADLLKRIQPTLPEESTEICLRPDLIEAWDAATEALQDAVAKGMAGARVSSKPKAQKEAAEKVQAIEAEIAAASATFRFRALPKDEWSALCDDHPPRQNNEVDQFLGYDRDAVLDAAVRASLIDPVFEVCEELGCDHDGCGSWQQFAKTVNSGEWEELRKTANSVNRGVVDPPKSALASQILTKRGGDSQ